MNGRLELISAILFAQLAISSLASADQHPNVLFIVVDDLNDWVGCLNGHPQADTPNIDRLAARGILFAKAHCAAPACNPSRAAVFSGRMPTETGVWSNTSGSLSRLDPESPTLATAFAGAGYRTLGTGKLLHSGGKSAFDEYYSVEQRWSPLTKKEVAYTDRELPSKGTDKPRHVAKDSLGRRVILPLNRMPSDRRPETKDGESFDWGPFDVPDSDFGDTRITDWAIEQLDQPHAKPFFLAVGYYRPHIPLWAPKRFFDRFTDAPGRLPDVKHDDLDDLSETARQWALEAVTAGSHATVVRHSQWHRAVEAYLACISYVDFEIGRLLDSLDRSPFAKNTLVVFWSDHGWHLGEKQHWGKWTGWERSTRVPFIVVPPLQMADHFAMAGSKCDQPVSLVDIYPTLAELCGFDAPENPGGESLVPMLRDPFQETERVVVTMFDEGNVSLRSSRWRFVRYADGSEELYDHDSDPHEWNNLAELRKYADIKLRLLKQHDLP